MSLKRLAENLDTIREDILIEYSNSKGGSYGDAVAFFKSGAQPDGGKWKDRIVPKLGFDNEPVITKAKKKNTKGGVVYTATLKLAPGKGGGAGIGIDPAASNHLFNIVGTDSKAIGGVAKAYSAFVKKHQRGLNEALRQWVMKPENFLHNIVGWRERGKYSIEDVSFKGISYGDPMVDPSRRKWPAGRTEIWIPVTAEIVVNISKKRS
jgi:hypothetical protein